MSQSMPGVGRYDPGNAGSSLGDKARVGEDVGRGEVPRVLRAGAFPAVGEAPLRPRAGVSRPHVQRSLRRALLSPCPAFR